MNANLAAPWYANGLRSLASALMGLAERLERPATPSTALEPRPMSGNMDEYLEDVRHRVAVGAQKLSRYY